MRKLCLVMVLAVVAAALGCTRASTPAEEKPAESATPTAAPSGGDAGDPALQSAPGTKHAWIYFTHNHDKDAASPYNTDCVATVVAERIGAKMTTSTQMGTKIIWHIRTSNGVNDDDKCTSLDTSQVNLRFATNVMGAAVMKKLTATGNTVQGTVSSIGDVGSIVDHKYQVYVGNDPAGPDPILVVGCGSCGE